MGPYSSHGHSSSSNMYTPIQPLNGINGAKSTCGSNGQHSVASLQMVWEEDQKIVWEIIRRWSDGDQIIDQFRVKRRDTTRWRQDDLSSPDRSSNAQWLKRIWNWFVKNQQWLWERFSLTHSRGSFKILWMTLLLSSIDRTPRNTQPLSWKDQIYANMDQQICNVNF